RLAPVPDGRHLVGDDEQLLQVTHGEGRDPMAVRQPALPRLHQAPRSGVGDAPPAQYVTPTVISAAQSPGADGGTASRRPHCTCRGARRPGRDPTPPRAPTP